MKLRSRPQAVLFDMDGLLFDTERICMDAFVTTRRMFGLSDAEDVFLRMVGTRSDLGTAILDESLQGQVTTAKFLSVWDPLIDEALDKGIPVCPGVNELLAQLSEAGVPMGVATSTSTHRAAKHLYEAGLFGYFARIVGGDQVQHPKPNPEPYLTLADLIGVEIHQCLAFEGSDPGTQAAVASGATVVQVPDLKPPSNKTRNLGHLVAPDLATGAVAIGLWDVISRAA